MRLVQAVASVCDAMREAFEEHYVPLLQFCYVLTRERQTAEDLVQDAFVHAAPKLPEVAKERTGAYLRAAAVNLWRKRLRRRTLERREMRRHLPVASERTPAEDRDVLWQAILKLPDRQRACLVLRYYEDRTERETARILGCSVGSVKSNTSKALSRLRRELSHES